jgi:hypothetical protein
MTQSPICIGCGDNYLFTRTYKGNYCPECHADWAGEPRSENRPRPQRTRTTPSIVRRDDERQTVPEPPYDDA